MESPLPQGFKCLETIKTTNVLDGENSVYEYSSTIREILGRALKITIHLLNPEAVVAILEFC